MLVGKSVYSDLHVIHSSSSCLRDINNYVSELTISAYFSDAIEVLNTSFK